MTQTPNPADVDAYLDTTVLDDDPVLSAALEASDAAGLPPIAVSAQQGKFLSLLAAAVKARRILEIGTLGGFSTIWLARGAGPDGRVTTLEYEPKHAEVARANIDRAGVGDRVEILVGAALDTLPSVTGAPFDLVFIDADKVNYPAYLAHIMRGVRSGSLLLADNVIRDGKVLSPPAGDVSAQAAREFNALLAADDRLEAIVLQQVGVKGHDGLAIARVK